MKCYNCNSIIVENEPQNEHRDLNVIPRQCPVCHATMVKEEYQCPLTSNILKEIKTIKDFGKFIGLFHVPSIALLVLAIVSLAVGIYFFATYTNRVVYMVLAFIAIVSFNFFLEMRKVEAFYKDFQKNKNRYIIAYAFKSEVRTFIADCQEAIPNDHIMKQRLNAYERRDKDIRLLRFKTYGMFHPQKPKLFNKKEDFFARHMNPKYRHFIRTGNYDDSSFIAFEGSIHGFLVMDSGIITIFNIPKLTKVYMSDKRNLLQ